MFGKKNKKSQNELKSVNPKNNKKDKKTKNGLFDEDEHEFEDLMEDLDEYN